MKRIRTILAILLTACVVATVQADESLQDIAESDQLRISAFVNRHYAPFVKDYLRVFNGHFRCGYDFIDDAEFDRLAEDALGSLSASIRDLLIERMQSSLTPMTAGQLDYASMLVALSEIDAHAERFTAELSGQGTEGNYDCAASLEENRAIYAGLPASLEASSGLKIPGD